MKNLTVSYTIIFMFGTVRIQAFRYQLDNLGTSSYHTSFKYMYISPQLNEYHFNFQCYITLLFEPHTHVRVRLID